MTPTMPRFVFVAGLHRTGTSLLSRLIASHRSVSAIENSSAPEDEGCYLQGAIPHTALHGIPGQFATDPAEHHIEEGRFDTLETRNRLLADWSPWFDADASWWLEKSPVNLTRMRLYQQLFPMAQFVVILRHPQIMAAALAKWSDRSPEELVRYGIEAYQRMECDLARLHAVVVIRYEDLVDDPDSIIGGVLAFLGLDNTWHKSTIRNGNADYPEVSPLEPEHKADLARWGYTPAGGVGSFEPIVRHPLRDVRERTAAAFASRSFGVEKKEQKANFGQ
ncbi:sulfotransferase [Erythrobacter litoralis]|uniref:sulfotransferase family protein n=1 Tax=Erythrobacter litoralis TaxID=39960 RepID=UPI00243482EE|nr:sulfotransferase [Erythrobacter litoralis]MDG6079706.1 sulfotransferase [Erythrobacter litoralis]